MASHQLITTTRVGQETRYFVDGRRATRQKYESIWDRAWYDGTLDSLKTEIREESSGDVIRHFSLARWPD